MKRKILLCLCLCVFAVTPKTLASIQEPDAEPSLLRDEILETYLNELAAKLMQVMPENTRGITCAVRIFEDRRMSAYLNSRTSECRIYISSGYFDFLENVHEIAGILAHEVGHEYLHHRGALAQEMVWDQAYIKLRKLQELEADRFSVRILLRARYDLEKYLALFLRLTNVCKNPFIPWTDVPYPSCKERISAMHEESELYRSTIPDADADIANRQLPNEEKFVKMKERLRVIYREHYK